MQFLQIDLDEIVQALAGLLVTLLLIMIHALHARIKRWIDARTTIAQRETLYRLAGEAMALSETLYGQLGGDEKLNQACRYVSSRIAELGFAVKPETIRAAIERAVLEYNLQVQAAKGDVRHAGA